jgi:transcriptional regulator with XRE-family HTH domain
MSFESYRKSLGLTQAQAAVALDLSSAGYLSRLETGSTPWPLRLALRAQKWSGGRVRALDLLAEEDAKLLMEALDIESPSATQAA